MSMLLRAAPLILVTAFAASSMALSQGAAGRTVWSGIYSPAQVERGTAAYAQHCASCHGDSLAGGDQAPPLTGGAFLANWNGQDTGALFTRIKTTMPLDNPGTLGGATVASIEAMILARNGYPAGQFDLPSDAATQSGITITPTKPAG